MDRWIRTLTVSAVILALGAAPALAGGDKAGHTAGKSKDTAPADSDFKGRHTMSGEVTKVDHQKGTLSLKTHEGTLDLHFPPASIKDVKQGDQISVQMAVKPGRAMRSSDAGKQDAGSASPATSGTTGAKKY
jgi:hypothetical protein